MELLSKIHGAKRWKNLFKNGWSSSFLGNDPLMGLDIGSRAIKLVLMKEAKGVWQLHQFQVKFLSSDIGANNVFDEEARLLTVLKDLLRETGIQEKRVATSISGPAVIIKSLEVPTMTEYELEEHLEWEIDRYIPYDVQDIYWDYHIPHSQKTKDSSPMTVRLVAAKKELVDRRIELLKCADLEPMVMDVDNMALANMYAINYGVQERENELLVNIGPSGLNMTMISEGRTKYVRDTPICIDWYRTGIQQVYESQNGPYEMTGSVAPDQWEKFRLLLEEVYQEVAEEIGRTIDYCRANEPGQEVQRLLLCGGHATLPQLGEFLRTQLNMSVEMTNPFRKLDVSPLKGDQKTFQNLAPLAGVAVGLALRKVGDR